MSKLEKLEQACVTARLNKEHHVSQKCETWIELHKFLDNKGVDGQWKALCAAEDAAQAAWADERNRAFFE